MCTFYFHSGLSSQHNYVNASASAGQIWSWRAEGGGGVVGGFENCVYLWKNPGYTPILYCIHHL